MKRWFVAAIVFAVCGLFLTGASAQPFIRIVSPLPGQCLPGPDVVVQFEAGGMTLGPSAWNLHFVLDDEPFHVQYDGNHAHVFKDVRPGSHTVRIFAANAMHEAIPGTLQTVSFSVAYSDGANTPLPGAPMLIYNLPQGEYLGIDAADITVDFLVSNVALSPSGARVAYYVDGRRFLVTDHCGPRHIKKLAPGLHRIKVELQDQHGDLLPGAFNSVERTILVNPDNVAKSADRGDKYTRLNLPRIDSIKGSMTMGQPWSATEAARMVTEEERRKASELTIRRDGAAPVSALPTDEEDDRGPAATTTDLDARPTRVVGERRSGTIMVESDEPGSSDDDLAPVAVMPANAPDDADAASSTRATGTTTGSAVRRGTTASRSAVDALVASTPAARATTATAGARTTGTLRLAAPTPRATPVTSVTLRVENPQSSQTRVVREQTTTASAITGTNGSAAPTTNGPGPRTNGAAAPGQVQPATSDNGRPNANATQPATNGEAAATAAPASAGTGRERRAERGERGPRIDSGERRSRRGSEDNDENGSRDRRRRTQDAATGPIQ